MVRKYPSPVRLWLGHRLFFTISKPAEYEVILNSPHALKKEALYKFAEPTVGTGLFTAPGELFYLLTRNIMLEKIELVPKWKRHRRVIMPTFNQKILECFVDVFVEQSLILVEQLRKVAGKGSFDIFEYVSRCTLDIICGEYFFFTIYSKIIINLART